MSALRRSIVIAVALAAALVGVIQPADAAPTGTAARNVLIIYVTWTAANGTPAAPKDLAVGDIERAVGVTANDWFKTMSHQSFGGWKATSVGPVGIRTPRLDNSQCGISFASDVTTEAGRAARAGGKEPSLYDTVLVYFGRTVCQWTGLHNGSTGLVHGTTANRTISQLLGRSLGLARADGLRCRTAKAYATLGPLCKREVGNHPFDVMGSGSGVFAAVEQSDLGWLSGRTRWASLGVRRYRIKPLEQTALGLQAVQLSEPDGVTLWLEYRRPAVLVHRQTPTTGLAAILLDMHPGGTFDDAGLKAGESFTSPYSGSRIKVVSTTAEVAVVEIDAKP